MCEFSVINSLPIVRLLSNYDKFYIYRPKTFTVSLVTEIEDTCGMIV